MTPESQSVNNPSDALHAKRVELHKMFIAEKITPQEYIQRLKEIEEPINLLTRIASRMTMDQIKKI